MRQISLLSSFKKVSQPPQPPTAGSCTIQQQREQDSLKTNVLPKYSFVGQHKQRMKIF